ncbi:MAG TPA: metallopeptidase family protein [Actinomycetes bacterium]|nr:metallopeptidase family protein [Actinomycetes bacterium]
MASPRVRRDRHGRGLRGPLAPPTVPASSSRAAHFDDVVLSAVERLELRWPDELETMEFAIEDIPPHRLLLTAWEQREVPLAATSKRTLAPPGTTPPRQLITFYRRPIELRCADHDELIALVRDVLAEQMGRVLDTDPEDIDPEYGE